MIYNPRTFIIPSTEEPLKAVELLISALKNTTIIITGLDLTCTGLKLGCRCRLNSPRIHCSIMAA